MPWWRPPDYNAHTALGTPRALHGAQPRKAPRVEAELGREPPSDCRRGPTEASRVGPRRLPWLRSGPGLSGTSLGNYESSRAHEDCPAPVFERPTAQQQAGFPPAPSAPGPPPAQGPRGDGSSFYYSPKPSITRKTDCSRKRRVLCSSLQWEAQRGPWNTEGEGKSELTNTEPLPG